MKREVKRILTDVASFTEVLIGGFYNNSNNSGSPNLIKARAIMMDNLRP
ncbi:hypothetical protein VCHA57P526_320002 [Vibrio chagasii]|nr:hypothetical protein VCHA29O37_700005 [Vibrio chagasii]CAH7188693.1 hypothetical protein VCHA40O231_360001 [Vibrio chagasii]CAH7315754.1 hypothetical protein VCHA53O474_370002 [Vibrio chagasii]CAH7330861.1 hypothetical protein VCHA51O444_330005 [Vibrio chagasii]CAH7335547.1 hypothetical protein VCHA54P495_540001 [Vibrio chagasii]